MPIKNGQSISPKLAASCRHVSILGVITMPISAGSVIAAGNDEATPKPTPIAEDQRRAFDGTNVNTPAPRQHMVLMKSDGHAEVTNPENAAQPSLPSAIAVQKFDVMIAMVSSPRSRW